MRQFCNGAGQRTGHQHKIPCGVAMNAHRSLKTLRGKINHVN